MNQCAIDDGKEFEMKICFLGSGALGSAIGGALSEAGADVTLIDQWQDHVDAMNTRGLTLREEGQDRIVRVKAATSPEGIGPADLVIVLVKSFHTRAAIEMAGAIIGPDTTVVSLQNGLGHEDILVDVVGRDKVIGGKTYLGGVLLAPGHVIAGLKGKQTIIGELDGRVSERVQRIAETFKRAGLLMTVSTNIMGTIWDKLLVNVATGALAGITRLPYGGLYQLPEIKACALAAIAEAIAVAKANGVALATDDPEQPWIKAAEGLPAEFKTSILQSLEKSSPTEIDFINGSVVRWGEKCGIPTPVNQTLVACVKGIEYWMANYAVK
jgi:2-dehydropantoate 2-reductase